MSEFRQRGPDYKGQLLTHGIDIDAIARYAYDAVRNDRLLGFPSGSDSVIASQGWCETTTPFITRELQNVPSLHKAGLYAHAENHTTGGSSRPEGLRATNGGHITHWYTTIARRENREPHTADIVVDATYKQFLRKEVRREYPNVFVGGRFAIAAIMERNAQSPYASEIYGLARAAGGQMLRGVNFKDLGAPRSF